MPVQQVTPTNRFPSGDYRDLVELRLTPEDLAMQYHLRFAHHVDGLDRYRLAAIPLDDDAQTWLLKYDGDRRGGTLIRVDAGIDLTRAKRLLKEKLDLRESDFVWVSPAVRTSLLA